MTESVVGEILSPGLQCQEKRDRAQRKPLRWKRTTRQETGLPVGPILPSLSKWLVLQLHSVTETEVDYDPTVDPVLTFRDEDWV